MGFGQYSYGGGRERNNPLAGEPKPAKRQKQVFPTDEIPHLWAHQTQAMARNAQGNLYFNGPVIYSYGTHFPIARHIVSKRSKAIVFTTRRDSVTTSGHITSVRQSIPPGITVFNIPLNRWSEGVPQHDESVAYYRAEIAEHYIKAVKARYWGLHDLNAMFAVREEAKKYAKFFGFKEKFTLPANPATLKKLRKQLDEKAIRGQAARDAQYAKQRDMWKRRDEIAAQKRAERLVTLPQRIEAWRNGGELDFDWNEIGAMLRVKDGEVQTSLGARVPADHALRAYRLLKLYRANGKTYQRNGHTIHLGNYAIDSLDEQGTLHAGCHHIKWEEVQRIGEQLLQSVDNAR